MKSINRRGVVLLQVLVVVILLAAIAGALLRLSFGRTIAVAQERNSLQGRAAAEAAYVQAMNCLTTCNAFKPSSGCSNAVATGACPTCANYFGHPIASPPVTMLSGTSISVTLGGSAPTCTLSVTCNNCIY